MSGTQRDLLKTRQARLGEVYGLNHLKAGQANSQLLSFGCTITKGGAGPNRQVLVSAGEVILAQNIVPVTAIAATSLPAGATTDASTFRKVLLELSPVGALVFVTGNGAATAQANAVLPPLTAANIAIGYIELPPSFTVDTTALTDPMIKQGTGTQVAYSA